MLNHPTRPAGLKLLLMVPEAGPSPLVSSVKLGGWVRQSGELFLGLLRCDGGWQGLSVCAGCGLGGQVFEVQGLRDQEASGPHSCFFSSSFIPRAGSLYAVDVTTVIPLYRYKNKGSALGWVLPEPHPRKAPRTLFLSPAAGPGPTSRSTDPRSGSDSRGSSRGRSPAARAEAASAWRRPGASLPTRPLRTYLLP